MYSLVWSDDPPGDGFDTAGVVVETGVVVAGAEVTGLDAAGLDVAGLDVAGPAELPEPDD